MAHSELQLFLIQLLMYFTKITKEINLLSTLHANVLDALELLGRI